MDSKKNIALIIHKLTSGGAQKMIANLSIYLQDYYNVHVIVFDGSSQTYPTGGVLHDLGLKPALNPVSQFFTFFKRVREVRKIKKAERIECSISFLDGPNLVNFLSKRKDRVILSVRSYLSLTPMNWFRKTYTSFISNHADVTVAISKMVQKDLVENFSIKQNKVITIYNSCDVETIRELANSDESGFNKLDGNFYFVTVGRLTEAKGHWHLIRAFNKLSAEYDNTRLVIVGKGELEDRTKKLVSDLNVGDKVIFTGFQNNPHSIVKKCDAFVFSSIFEGFGNVIVDALALSKAVIATDCFTGPRDILAPNTDLEYQTDKIEKAKYGVLVPVGDKGCFNSYDKLTSDENSLYEAMKLFLVDKEIKSDYEAKSSERADFFSVNSSKMQWINLIDKLCSEE